MAEEIKLFAVKYCDDVFYVPATTYGQAEGKYKDRWAKDNHGMPENAPAPDKITIACDAAHLIMPANFDIDT